MEQFEVNLELSFVTFKHPLICEEIADWNLGMVMNMKVITSDTFGISFFRYVQFGK